MSGAAPLLVRSWKVGDRYRVTLTIPRYVPGGYVCAPCEWHPTMPKALTPSEKRDYLLGLEEAVAALQDRIFEGTHQ